MISEVPSHYAEMPANPRGFIEFADNQLPKRPYYLKRHVQIIGENPGGVFGSPFIELESYRGQITGYISGEFLEMFDLFTAVSQERGKKTHARPGSSDVNDFVTMISSHADYLLGSYYGHSETRLNPRNIAGTVSEYVSAAMSLADRDFKNNNLADENTFVDLFKFYLAVAQLAAAASFYTNPDAKLNDYYKSDRSEKTVYRFGDIGPHYGKYVDRVEKGIKESRQFLDLISKHPEVVEHLKSIPLGYPADQNPNFWTLFSMYYGLPPFKMRFQSEQIIQKYHQFFRHKHTLSGFIEYGLNLMKGVDPFIHFKAGQMEIDPAAFDSKQYPLEVLYSLQQYEATQALEKINAVLGTDDWKIFYPYKSMAQFDADLIERFIIRAQAVPVVAKAGRKQMYSDTASSALRQVHNPLFDEIPLSNSMGVRCLLQLLRTVEGTRLTSPDSPFVHPSELTNRLNALNLINAHATGDYSDLAIADSPSRTFYRWWSQNHPKWEEVKNRLHFSDTIAGRMIKCAIIETLIDRPEEFSREKWDLRESFKFREPTFFNKLDKLISIQNPLERIVPALEAIAAWKGPDMFLETVGAIAVNFRESETFGYLESLVLCEIARGNSLSGQIEKLGISAQHQAAVQRILESFQHVLLRYPPEWSKLFQ